MKHDPQQILIPFSFFTHSFLDLHSLFQRFFANEVGNEVLALKKI